MARTFASASTQGLTVANPIVTAYPITMACWFRPANVTKDNCLMGACDNGGSSDFICLFADGSTGGDPVVAIQRTGGTFAYATGGTFTAGGAIHHACGVFRSSTDREVYLNGASVGTDATSLTLAANMDSFDIGYRKTAAGDSYCDADIWEAAVWSVGLDVAEIAALAKGFTPLMIRPSALLAYWPLPGAGSSERDRWKNGRNLTLVGTPTKGDNGIVLRRD